LKSKIYKTIISPVVLDECEIWSFTLKEEHRLSVFENRVLRRIFGCKWKWQTGKDCIMRSFITSMLHQILLERSSQGG
jgi:hypothetical protein